MGRGRSREGGGEDESGRGITETAKKSISNGQSLASSTSADILDALFQINLVRTELLKQHYSSSNDVRFVSNKG